MSAPDISFSISTRISMRSSMVPSPVMYWVSNGDDAGTSKLGPLVLGGLLGQNALAYRELFAGCLPRALAALLG
jgi:hypothetical protein